MENNDKKIQIRLYIFFIAILLYLAYGVCLFYYFENSASIQRRQEYHLRCEDKKKELESLLIKDLEDMMNMEIEHVSENFTINSNFYNKIIKNIDEIDQCHLYDSGVNVKEVNIPNAISFVYAITITLGSGDIYAITSEGKIFFILFSSLSIPLIIAFYVDLTEGIIGSIVCKFNCILLYIKNKLSKNVMNEVTYKNELKKLNKKQLPYYVLFSTILISMFIICTCNHYYQSKLAQKNDTVLQSMTFIFENFALIGLGYNVPADTVKYLTRELPLMVLGAFLFSLYINLSINFIRHSVPKMLNNYRNRRNQDTGKFDFMKYIIYKHEEDRELTASHGNPHFY
uniref:Ion_trans_2 domain-containing protein n=1 Tax=Strongyloides papillosus TaxID=174720 RepID=A0A0N5B787_STREA